MTEVLDIQTFVLFDTETTGLPSPGNNPKITELALLALTRNELLHKQAQPRVLCKLVLCVDPRKMIGHISSEISGLHNDALEQLSTFKTQAGIVTEFLANLPQPVCLIAHNGNGFDFPLLKAELQLAGQSLSCQVLCVDSLEALREMDGLPRKHPRATQRKGSQKKDSPDKVAHTPEVTKSPGEKRSAVESSDGSPSKISARESPLSGAIKSQDSTSKTPVEEEKVNKSWKVEEVTPLKHSFISLQSTEINARRKLFEPKDVKSGPQVLDSQATVPYSLDSDLKEPLTDSERDLCLAMEKAEDLHHSNSKDKNVGNLKDGELVSASQTSTDSGLVNARTVSTKNPSQEGDSQSGTDQKKLDVDSKRGSSRGKQQAEKEDRLTKIIKGHATATPSTPSYKLGEVYARMFGQQPEVAHAAEDDCVTLMKIVRLKGLAFVRWCNTNAVSLDSIEPMYCQT